jgi:hypothetical protein
MAENQNKNILSNLPTLSFLKVLKEGGIMSLTSSSRRTKSTSSRIPRSNFSAKNKYFKVSIKEIDESNYRLESSVDDVSASGLAKSSSTDIETTAFFSAEFRNSVLAWVSMCLAVISGSSIGPVFKYMSTHGLHPMQSASWRCQCMLIWLGPLAIIEIVKESEPVTWFETRPGLRYPVYIHVIFSGVFWAGNLLTWIVGLQFTTTGSSFFVSCEHQ